MGALITTPTMTSSNSLSEDSEVEAFDIDKFKSEVKEMARQEEGVRPGPDNVYRMTASVAVKAILDDGQDEETIIEAFIAAIDEEYDRDTKPAGKRTLGLHTERLLYYLEMEKVARQHGKYPHQLTHDERIPAHQAYEAKMEHWTKRINQLTANPNFDMQKFARSVVATAKWEDTILSEDPYLATVEVAIRAILEEDQDEATIKSAFQKALEDAYPPVSDRYFDIPGLCMGKLTRELEVQRVIQRTGGTTIFSLSSEENAEIDRAITTKLSQMSVNLDRFKASLIITAKEDGEFRTATFGANTILCSPHQEVAIRAAYREALESEFGPDIVNRCLQKLDEELSERRPKPAPTRGPNVIDITDELKRRLRDRLRP